MQDSFPYPIKKADDVVPIKTEDDDHSTFDNPLKLEYQSNVASPAPSLPASPQTKPEPDTQELLSTSEPFEEVIFISDDEDEELDETEDGIIGPDYIIKQDFPEEVQEHEEKGVIDCFLEDLIASFSRALGSKIQIESPKTCCSIMHSEIRFTIRSLPVDIEWVDMQSHAEDAVTTSKFMMGSWVAAHGDIYIHMAKDPLVASLPGLTSSGYMVADPNTTQTCRLTMATHDCNNFVLHDDAIQKEYQTFAYLLKADLRLNAQDISQSLRYLSDHRIRMRDMTSKSMLLKHCSQYLRC